MTEVWKPVVGYEGLYEVSDMGRVRSLPRRVNGGGTRFYTRPGQLMGGPTGLGYRSVNLTKNGKETRFQVHRIVLDAFIGPCPHGMEGCHNNGIGDDNRLENLRWDSRAGNQADREKHGTHQHGEQGPGAKLRTEDVLVIRSMMGKAKQKDIAAMFGVGLRTVQHIVAGTTWRNIEGPQ